MQEYFERKVFPDVPDVQMQLSFAGTLMELFVDLMGPVFQILSARFGIRFVLILGSIIMVLGLELASLSTEVSLANKDILFILTIMIRFGRSGMFI